MGYWGGWGVRGDSSKNVFENSTNRNRKEPKWNRNGTEMEPKWNQNNKKGTEMEPKLIKMEPKWNQNAKLYTISCQNEVPHSYHLTITADHSRSLRSRSQPDHCDQVQLRGGAHAIELNILLSKTQDLADTQLVAPKSKFKCTPENWRTAITDVTWPFNKTSCC